MYFALNMREKREKALENENRTGGGDRVGKERGIPIENQQEGGRCLDDPRGKLNWLYTLAQDQL